MNHALHLHLLLPAVMKQSLTNRAKGLRYASGTRGPGRPRSVLSRVVQKTGGGGGGGPFHRQFRRAACDLCTSLAMMNLPYQSSSSQQETGLAED